MRNCLGNGNNSLGRGQSQKTRAQVSEAVLNKAPLLKEVGYFINSIFNLNIQTS